MASVATLPRGTKNGHKPVAEAELAPTQLIIGIPVDLIDVGTNVRVNVDGIDELAASIKEHGLKQPIKVRADGARWAVVYGQRRLLAHRLAGIERIPAIVADEDYTAGSLAIEQLVENLHRSDLPPLDRARAMRAVVDAGTSQADLARELGLHPSTIANDLRLLTLDPRVLTKIESGDISPSHAKAIASLPRKQQHELAERAVTAKWSSHDLEREIKWKEDQATQEAAKTARTERVTPRVVAVLEKAGTPKTAALFVHGPWDVNVDAVVAAVKKAGWKGAVSRYTYGGRPAACDCSAIRVEISGRGASLQPTCTNDKHQAVGRDLEHEARLAAEKERQRLGGELLEVVRRDLGIARPRHTVLALISWSLETWHQETWEVHAAHSEDEFLDDIARSITAHQHVREIDLAALVETMQAAQGARADRIQAVRTRKPKVPA